MSILDRIKNLFNKNREALPKPQIQYENNRNTPNNTYFLPRRDGSTLEITPIYDNVGAGYPTYKQVKDSITKQMKLIPKFRIMHNVSHGRTMQSEIFMDINPELLNNPKYADFIANEMLSEQRISKVLNEYGNYAGTITQSENGILGKAKEEWIINTLKREECKNAQQNQADRLDRENAYTKGILEDSQKYDVNYKTSHAEDLSEQEWYR